VSQKTQSRATAQANRRWAPKRSRTVLVRDEERGDGGADIGEADPHAPAVEIKELRRRRRRRGHREEQRPGRGGAEAEQRRGGGEDGDGGEEVDGGEEDEEEGRGGAEDPAGRGDRGVNANLGVEIPEPVGRGEVVEERVRLRAGRGARCPRGERVVVVVNSHQLLHFLRRPAA